MKLGGGIRTFIAMLLILTLHGCEENNKPADHGWSVLTYASSFSSGPFTELDFVFDFEDEKTGYLCLNEYLSPSSGTNVYIKKTMDGGVSWSNLYEENRYGNLYDILSTGEDTCIALSNTEGILSLIKSFDGGSSWNVFPLYANLAADWTLDDHNNLIVAVYGAHPGRIIRIRNDSIEQIFESDSVDLNFAKIAFPTLNNGYIVTGDYYSSRTLLSTQNAGESWQVSELPDTARCNDLTFISAETGYFACNAGLLYTTSDAGVSWSIIETETTEDLNYIGFKGSTGYCTGKNGTILRTYHGVDWHQWNSEIESSINKIQMFDTVSGFFATSAALFKYSF